MAQAKQGDTVKVHYTGRLADGTVFDTSAERQPLEFTIGGGDIIPTFEEAVVGMSPGESKTVEVPADQAYGPHYEDLVMVVGRGEFPEDMDPQVGDCMQLNSSDGRTLVVAVTGTDESNVTLDANHPLAGQDLMFDITLVEAA